MVSKKVIEDPISVPIDITNLLKDKDNLPDPEKLTYYNDLNNKIATTNTLVNKNTSNINSVKSELLANNEALKTELLASNEALKNEVDNSIQENKQYTEEKINELLNKVCYVSNVEELKEALKTNKHIKLLEGIYQLTSSLELEEYTTLEGLGKVVIQGNGINNYIRNKSTTETTAYNGASNIIIRNIITTCALLSNYLILVKKPSLKIPFQN